MMSYNPTVNDRSGEITAAYQMKTAEQDMQTKQFLGEQIGNVGTALTGAIAKSRETTAKLEGVQATGQAMQAILPQYGEEGMALGTALQEQLGKAGNNPDKMAGAMMAFMPAMENLQSRFNQNNQYNQALKLAQQKAALGGGGGSNPVYSVELGDGIDMNQ